MNKILQFKDEYRFLSNFWLFETKFSYGGDFYPTSEHFYVAMKTKNLTTRTEISLCKGAGNVKKLGKSLVLRDDWESIKLEVMLYILRYKFSNANPSLRGLLLNTGDLIIEEGNYWGDTFWGVDLKTGLGENNLGKLLMQVREEIKSE